IPNIDRPSFQFVTNLPRQRCPAGRHRLESVFLHPSVHILSPQDSALSEILPLPSK
ncbi:unnamed protein product, partial [Ectocarpus sp. 4 AP-2014]